MPPLQYLRAESLRHVEPALGTGTRTRLILEGSLDLPLHVPGERRHDPGPRQDGDRTLESVILLLELAGESVRLDILGTWAIRQRKMET